MDELVTGLAAKITKTSKSISKCLAHINKIIIIIIIKKNSIIIRMRTIKLLLILFSPFLGVKEGERKDRKVNM